MGDIGKGQLGLIDCQIIANRNHFRGGDRAADDPLGEQRIDLLGKVDGHQLAWFESLERKLVAAPAMPRRGRGAWPIGPFRRPSSRPRSPCAALQNDPVPVPNMVWTPLLCEVT